MSRQAKDLRSAGDILENVAVKIRCMADIVAGMDHNEDLYLSPEGLAGLYGFLDHIYTEIRAADARLTT